MARAQNPSSSSASRSPGHSRVRAAPRVESDDYFTLSRRPLYALVVLTPLVALYEVLAIAHLTNTKDQTQLTIKAENMLGQMFKVFSVTGLLAPALLMLTVLLIWHVLSKDRWAIRPGVVAGMFVESVLWALPLLVLGAVVLQVGAKVAPAAAALNAAGLAEELTARPWQARLAISLGAGIYEELVFRLIGLAVLHIILRDLLRMPKLAAEVLAVLLTAVAFAFYHDVYAGGSGLAAIKWADLSFFFAAGVYFAVLYLSRGFGIVVLCHAAYDIIVLLGRW